MSKNKINFRDQIAIMRQGGRLLAATLDLLSSKVAPGVSLSELDQMAYNHIKAGGGEPSFLNYRPSGAAASYPASICASVNETVVHGLPGDYRLKEGDIVSLDLGVKYQGFHTDSARTVPVGKISAAARHLLEVTETALHLGIAQARPGRTLGDIGHAISRHAKANKVTVIRDLTGHGISRELHEEPTVWNVGEPGRGLELTSGLTIAIEPMFSLGSAAIKQEDDDSYRTADRSLSAHFEHTVAITDDGPVVLTK